MSLQSPKKLDKAWAAIAQAFIPSAREAEAVLSLSLSPAWSIEEVPAQPGLPRETLPKKIKERDRQRQVETEEKRDTKKQTDLKTEKERDRAKQRQTDLDTDRARDRDRCGGNKCKEDKMSSEESRIPKGNQLNMHLGQNITTKY